LLFKAWKLFAVEQPKLAGLHTLIPQHGIDADELSGLFGRLAVSSKVLAQGFGKDEHSGLFTDLDQPGEAQARMPAFLARIANPGKAVSWTLDEAREKWYWGYIWSGTGLSPKSIFEDWMWWCGELHLFTLEDSTARVSRWIPLPRATLDSALVEADNWLNGSDVDGYRETVKTLERVYGLDRIPGLFAPKGAAPQGTETNEAIDHLEEGRRCFNTVKIDEETLTDKDTDDLEVVRDAMPKILKARSDILRLLGKVKQKDGPRVSIDNFRTIRLEDHDVSLFERIERARLFAEHVDRCSTKIAARANELIEFIHDDLEAQPPFPQRLFTLTLETIRNILAGALQKTADTATQQQEATGGSDTLLHYLRSLQLDKASERLELLGQEVGYDLHSDTSKPIMDIDGYILQSFRQFKERFKSVSEHTKEVEQRIATAMKVLDPLPADYKTNSHPADLVLLQQNLTLVDDSFEELDEKVDEVRGQLMHQARKGQFSALRDIPVRLLKSIQQQANTLGGKLLTIENSIQQYKKERIERANSNLRSELNPLFTACGESVIPALTMSDIEPLTLHDLNVDIDLRRESWRKRAEKLIEVTGVNLARWQEIARTLLANGQPVLTEEERSVLVDKGILRVQITFGGRE